MNREILFKGKRTDNGEWLEGYLFRISEKLNPFIMLVNRGAESREVDPSTICQYTGLTDKNGNKIWENDIIKKYVPVYEIGKNAPVGERWLVGVVEWSTGGSEREPGFWALKAHDEKGNPCGYIFTSGFEVCGNVFDNPELINKEVI